MERSYIEVVGGIGVYRWNLSQADLRLIGEFTRWRVAGWLYDRLGPEDSMEDFHAVCGNIDIPWDTEAARLIWNALASSESASGQPINPAV
jgi:hypothetical protein